MSEPAVRPLAPLPKLAWLDAVGRMLELAPVLEALPTEPTWHASGEPTAEILCLLVRGRHQQHTERFRPEAAPDPAHRLPQNRLKLVCRRVRDIIVGDLLGGNRPVGVVYVVHGHCCLKVLCVSERSESVVCV
jgi:hypothetical protein